MLTEYLRSTNHHLGDALWTSCEKMIEIGDSARKQAHHYVRHTEYTMEMMEWKYKRDISRLKEKIKRMEELQNDDVVEKGGRGGEFVGRRGEGQGMEGEKEGPL